MGNSCANETVPIRLTNNESRNILLYRHRELNLKLIYGFIPQSGNLEDIIEKRAYELAKEIVNRTSISMKLEDQKNNPARIQKAIKEKANEIKTEIPVFSIRAGLLFEQLLIKNHI